MPTMADDPILWSSVVDAAKLVASGARLEPLTDLMPEVAEVYAERNTVMLRFVDGSERMLTTFE